MRTPSPIMTFVLTLILMQECLCVDSLPKPPQILSSPISTINGAAQNISICFADCQSCQSVSAECETCFSPWFQLSGGNCQLSSSYFLQSTVQEQRSTNFIASSEWRWNGVPAPTANCLPTGQTFTHNFSAIGPFSSGSLVYQRTISIHNYYSIKFLLILSNWTASSSIQISITNQNNIKISQTNLSLSTGNIKNSYLQSLCSSTALDRRVSLTLQLSQQQSSQLTINFTSNMDVGSTWSLSSFVLVTGSCNSNCSSCTGYTPQGNGCQICNNFLSNSDTSKCSTCGSGFRYNSAQNKCYKCPIQLKQCSNNSATCEYPTISNTTTNTCAFTNTSYFDIKELTEQTFFGSLYSVQSKGALTTQCGTYSVVGPASFNDIISRTYLTLPPHIMLSISLNIFIFDQPESTQRYSIAFLINGQSVTFPNSDTTITMTGTSNECDLSGPTIKYQAIKTYSTYSFIAHKSTQNVVVGVTLGAPSVNNAVGWGIRDMRLIFKRCDERCQNCTQNGCQQCSGLFQLNQMECSSCLVGTGASSSSSSSSVCLPCVGNCLKCNYSANSNTANSSICTQCADGFYLYTKNNITKCQINPNYGPALGGSLGGTSGCSVTLPGSPNKTLSFQTLTNRAKKTFTMPSQTSHKNVQFYLMKIDNWEGDYLDIYLNDLLVKRVQYFSSGSQYCGNQTQNDEISLQQFNIRDNNNTLTIQFQVVSANAINPNSITNTNTNSSENKNRQFGVADLRVYPVGCVDCENRNFQYSLKYNFDERLFVQMAFNLVYINNDPQDFKNIFVLRVGNKTMDYQISTNDSIRYWLKSQPITQGEILDKNVSVECKYPLRVGTQIPADGTESGLASVNKYDFFTGRALQATSNDSYQNTKTLDNSMASVWVDRFAPLGNRENGVKGLQTFFSVLTRIIIYLGFASFFIGCQTSCTHVMHNFQKLWVHIYVASLALSPIFKTALWGFRECQDQNIAVNPQKWESGLPQYLYYDAPAQYQQYYKDITFFRHIYNVGVAFAVLIIIFVVFHFVFKRFKKTDNTFIRHMRVTFVHRPLFYFNSVIFYQYFTVVIACCLQFLDLKTRTNSPTFAGINAAACIIAFIFATLYPVFIHILLHRKRAPVLGLLSTIMSNNRNKQFQNHLNDLNDLEEQQVIYNNKYSQIFYRFLPKQLWNPNLADSEMISQKHFFYNLFRFGDLWWHAIVVILLYYSPFAQAFLLVLTNGLHLAINTFAELDSNKYLRVMKSIQLLCFMVIEILIIVMNSLLKTLRFQSYQTLGIVAIIFVFFILLTTFIRFLYTLFRLWKQYRYTKDDDVRGVIRRDVGFKRGWSHDYRIN